MALGCGTLLARVASDVSCSRPVAQVSATAGVDRAEPAEGIRRLCCCSFCSKLGRTVPSRSRRRSCRYNEELTNKIVSELLPLPEGYVFP